jgi:hypothetical protein
MNTEYLVDWGSGDVSGSNPFELDMLRLDEERIVLEDLSLEEEEYGDTEYVEEADFSGISGDR